MAAPAPAELLLDGTIDVRGRIMPASNATFLADLITADRDPVACVYKPISGEKPLWDFPHGTLADREVAAYVVSEALGWGVVPPTVLRDGPAGPGMVQLWCEPDAGIDAVDLVPQGPVPDGFLHVLDAFDHRDRPISLIHEDSEPLRRMAAFDVLINNTDRKGGHVLALADGVRLGVDHGVGFHVEDKLRTVLWGWAGRSLGPALCADIERVAADEALLGRLLSHLLPEEVEAFVQRCRDLLRRGSFPLPSGDWPSIPWPAF